MSDKPWNPDETQELDRIEHLRTERAKREAIVKQVQAMAVAVGKLQTECTYLKWLCGILIAAVFGVMVKH